MTESQYRRNFDAARRARQNLAYSAYGNNADSDPPSARGESPEQAAYNQRLAREYFRDLEDRL